MIRETTEQPSAGDPARHNEPLLFLHIPKTAGTALRSLFARELGEDRVTKGLPAMPLEEALIRYADFDAICGHFHAQQGCPLPAGRLSITVLRDPVDRFLSYFYFRKFDAQESLIDQRVRSLDVEGFIDQLTNDDADELNMQTTLLYPLGTDAQTLPRWPERVRAAQRALDRIDYVGIHDEIDDFVCMLCARMGWSSDTALERINVTSQRAAPEHLSAAARKRLDHFLQHDRAVYEHAVERFRQQRRTAILRPGPLQDRPRIATDASTAGIVPRAAPTPAPREFGDRRLELLNVWAVGELSGNSAVLIGEQLNIHVDFVAHEPADDLTIGFLIRDERGLPVYGTNTRLLGDTCRVTPGTYRVTFSLMNRIADGAYVIDAKLICSGSHLKGCYHWKDEATRFDVHGWATTYFAGRAMMDPTAYFVRTSSKGSIKPHALPLDPTKPALSTGRLNPPLDDFSARIAVACELPAVQTGTELLVDVELENTGAETWRANGKRPVCLSYHWHDMKGHVIEFDGVRTRLPRDIAPGERVQVVGLLRSPQAAGALRLTWTLVQEEIAWFDQSNPDARCQRDVRIT